MRASLYIVLRAAHVRRCSRAESGTAEPCKSGYREALASRSVFAARCSGRDGAFRQIASGMQSCTL